MGIADRDYYREDPRWRNPLARAQATVALVIIYASLFVGQLISRDEAKPLANQLPLGKLTETLQLEPNKVFAGELWRVASYALVHDIWGIWHIAFTALFLIWIGHQVEDLYGWKEYLAFFVLTTLLGGAAYVGASALTGDNAILRGPSGAVTAILVLFALHYPTRTVWFMFFLPIPVWLLVVGYATIDVLGVATGQPNVPAVATHVVAASFAFLHYRYSLRVLNWVPLGQEGRRVRRVTRPQFRAPSPEPEPAATAAVGARPAVQMGPSVDEHLEAKLDEVLEKVTRHGKDSLTDGERDILLRASEVYKKRRQSG